MTAARPTRPPLRERLLVVGALLVLFTALLMAPLGRESPADAAPTRFQCGANDANRATLSLYNGAGTLRPCVSKATMNMTVAKSGENKRYRLSKVRAVSGSGTEPVKYIDGTSENLFHVTFESFVIDSNAKMTVTPPAGGPSYSVALNPDSAASVGGTGINTDLWVTGDSTLNLPNPLLFGICTNFKVSTFASLSWLLNGTSWSGCGMDLDIRFLAVYKPGGTTTGTYPIKLPNTTIDVTPK